MNKAVSCANSMRACLFLVVSVPGFPLTLFKYVVMEEIRVRISESLPGTTLGTKRVSGFLGMG